MTTETPKARPASRLRREYVVFRIEGKDGKVYKRRCGEDHVVGGACKRPSLPNELVETIRQAYEDGEGGYRKLARRFNLHPTTVRDIVTFRRRLRG